jgi:hypothetical protein
MARCHRPASSFRNVVAIGAGARPMGSADSRPSRSSTSGDFSASIIAAESFSAIAAGVPGGVAHRHGLTARFVVTRGVPVDLPRHAVGQSGIRSQPRRQAGRPVDHLTVDFNAGVDRLALVGRADPDRVGVRAGLEVEDRVRLQRVAGDRE